MANALVKGDCGLAGAGNAQFNTYTSVRDIAQNSNEPTIDVMNSAILIVISMILESSHISYVAAVAAYSVVEHDSQHGRAENIVRFKTSSKSSREYSKIATGSSRPHHCSMIEHKTEEIYRSSSQHVRDSSPPKEGESFSKEHNSENDLTVLNGLKQDTSCDPRCVFLGETSSSSAMTNQPLSGYEHMHWQYLQWL